MKNILAILTLPSAAITVSAEPFTACGAPEPIAALYVDAVQTGGEAQKKQLGAALYPVVQCLTKKNVLQPSRLRGPFAIVIEVLSVMRGVPIVFVTDAQIAPDAKAAAPYHNRGYAHNNLRQYEKAIEDYDKVLELNPNDASAYIGRGYAYNKLKQYGKAIGLFQSYRAGPESRRRL